MKQKISGFVKGVICSFVCASTLITSCTYDSRSGIEPTLCDTTKVTYSLTIRPILINTCIECHSATNPSDNLNYENYTDIAAVAKDGRLLGAIKHLPGYVPMPEFAPMLPDCQIQKIQKWVNDGAPNN